MSTIFHLALRHEWEAAQRDGAYRRSTIGKSLDDESFIHCSFAEQVEDTARLFYAGRDDVLVLTIDTDRVPAPLKIEGGFPHIYGELPVAAVIEVRPL